MPSSDTSFPSLSTWTESPIQSQDETQQGHLAEVECPPSPQEAPRKRKRSEDVQATPSARRQRLGLGRPTSPPQSRTTGTGETPLNHEKIDPVEHWVRYNTWPSIYSVTTVPAESMAGVRQKSSERVSKSASGQRYWDLDFTPSELEAASSSRRNLLNDLKTLDFFQKHSKSRPEGLTESAQETCRKVLESKDAECKETGPWIFYNDQWFERAFERLETMNESKVVQDMKPLVVPPVEQFYYSGDDSLKYLTESVDETWSVCVPILRGNVPKPGYAAGYFRDVAFTEEQQKVLEQFRTPNGDSLVRVTRRMVFPFLSCEAKSGTSDAPGLNEAEKQNVEDTLIAMRGVIELFKRANRASEIQLEILAFSVVYNDHEVRLFAHYADVYVDSPQPQFYRQKIYQSFFPDVRLAVFRMIKYIYKVWAREHWERICSAIETLSKMPAYASSTASSSASGCMPLPPSEPRSRSSNARSQFQRSLKPDTSSDLVAKKPKTSGWRA